MPNSKVGQYYLRKRIRGTLVVVAGGKLLGRSAEHPRNIENVVLLHGLEQTVREKFNHFKFRITPVHVLHRHHSAARN